jgi:hypothetical protein
MRIYRMENADREGPFVGITNKAEARGMWQHVPWIKVEPGALVGLDKAHPHHLKDVFGLDNSTTELLDEMGLAEIVLPDPGQWVVGCVDLAQFYHWFPPKALPDFAKFGMTLDIYECPDCDVKKGQYQVLFRRDRARLLKSEPLTHPLAA